MKIKPIYRFSFILIYALIYLLVDIKNLYIGILADSILLLLIALALSSIPCSAKCSIKKSLVQYLFGVATGALLIFLIISILYYSNQINLATSDNIKWFIIIIVIPVWIVQSFVEEYIFRGILFDLLNQRKGKIIAISFTSLLFALLHSLNPNFSLIGFGCILLFGVLCGIFTAIFHNIYLCCGFHFIWNYLQGNIFGINVSGTTSVDSIYQYLPNGHILLTGGDFGIEGSIISLILVSLLIIIILVVMQLKKWYTNKYQGGYKNVDQNYNGTRI